MEKPTHITSSSQFDKTLSTYKVVIVDFYADWCGPCKAIAPVFESLCAAESKPGRVTFCKVDVDNQRDIASRYGVTAMPTFVTIVGGAVKETIRGANPGALRAAVKSAVAAGGSGPSASFQSKGHVLGSGNAVRGNSGSSASSAPVDIASLIPGNFIGTIVRFIGLYFTTLMTLDPKEAAEQSPFRNGADPTRKRGVY